MNLTASQKRMLHAERYLRVLVHVPIYQLYLNIVVARDPNKYCADVGTRRDEPIAGGVDVLGEGHFRVVLAMFGTSNGVIAHEAFHLSMRTAEYLDLPFACASHEHLAYLHQYFFEAISDVWLAVAKEVGAV